MLNPETIIENLPIALADSDIEAIHDYCEAENRRIVLLKQANARFRAARIREASASVRAARIAADAGRREFDRIITQVSKTDTRITACIRSGVLPERID